MCVGYIALSIERLIIYATLYFLYYTHSENKRRLPEQAVSWKWYYHYNPVVPGS